MNIQKSYNKAFSLLTSLFFMWGLITVLVDFLVPRLKDVFELTYFQAGLVQFAFFIAYGIVSIPAGSLLQKIGYKNGIILGLLIMGCGCLLFYEAAELRYFWFFMVGYFVLASGMTILQVAANPYVTVLGDEKTASFRLNLSQAFNSLGTAIAPAIGAIFILSDNIKSVAEIKLMDSESKEIYFIQEASAVQKPFIVLSIALLLLAFAVKFIELPKLLNTNSETSYLQALKNRKLKLGAVAIFLYVGAEVAIGSYLVNYFIELNIADTIRSVDFTNNIVQLIHQSDITSIDDKGIVGTFVLFYWLGAMFGRFLGSYLTNRFKPQLVLSFFAFFAIICIFLSILSTGLVAMWFVLAVGLFNSIMFPTIFSIAIDGLGDLKPNGSGILCTAIAGGAFIPPLFGFLTDISGFKLAFILTVVCYSYILFFSKKVESI